MCTERSHPATGEKQGATPHTLEDLEGWVAEFVDRYAPLASEVRVVVQDGEGGADTGLIEVRMRQAGTVTTVAPENDTSGRWVISFEAREEPLRLDADGVMKLSRELAVVSQLAGFLDARSAARE